MKTKLLSLCFTFFMSSFIAAQNEGWFQYAPIHSVNEIYKDAEDNIHLATNIGYIKYNPTTQEVLKQVNLVSHNLPVGNCVAVKVNPADLNEVALIQEIDSEYSLIIIKNDDVSIYNSDNSSFDVASFGSPKLYYSNMGLLYLYNVSSQTPQTGYQTFNNNTFTERFFLNTHLNSITENAAGTKVYFGQNGSGLRVLDKSTGAFTIYNANNSALINSWVNNVQLINNIVYVLTPSGGVTTIDANDNWITYQEPRGTAMRYIEPYDDDRFLIGHSASLGHSLVNLQTNTWEAIVRSSYCNSNLRIGIEPSVVVDGVIYTLSRNRIDGEWIEKFESMNGDQTNCTAIDGYPFNVIDTYSFDGLISAQVRENPNNSDMLETFIVNANDTHLRKLNIPKTGFDGNFSIPEDVFESTQNISRTVFLNGDTNNYVLTSNVFGLWINDGTDTIFVAHPISNFHSYDIKLTHVEIVNGEPVGTLVLTGFDGSNNYRVYKTQLDVANQSVTPYEELFPDNRDLGEFIKFDCSNNVEEGKTTCAAITRGSAVLNEYNFSGMSWDTETNGAASEDFSDEITEELPEQYFSLFTIDPLAPEIKIDVSYTEISGDIISRSETQDGGIDYSRKRIEVVNTDAVGRIFADYTESINRKIGIGLEDDEISWLKQKRENNNNGEYREYTVYHGGLIPPIGGIRPNIKGQRSGNNNIILRYFEIPETRLLLPENTIFYTPIETIFYNRENITILVNTNQGLFIKPLAEIDLDAVLSTSDVTTTQNIGIVYPNPTNNIVTIKDVDVKTIDVYNISGALVKQFTNQKIITVNDLASGMYVLKITDVDNNQISKKLVVK